MGLDMYLTGKKFLWTDWENDENNKNMIKDKHNPLTNADLIALIKRSPDRWSRYSKFIGKLTN